ncbi:MAG: trimeric intracellular cation channel family protein [Bacteroidetes bacterium]|nr:trimeric intracellular cation channel family protein [Bacteroidota bacterium]MBS1934182.1 trimeric intracellular cation channel family protein [Bacteroidota bacterium]
MNLVDIILYTGVFVFAVTGALKARTHHMDIFGAAVLGFVTAYGGGTIRDVLIGIKPVNWVNDYIALSLVIGAVLIVSLVKKNIPHFRRIVFITDAIGIGMFTVGGIEKSLEHGVNSVYAVLMGVISATFGGLVADILSNTVPDLLKRGELYATVCLFGGIIYMLLLKAGISREIDLIICVILIVAIRIISKLKRLRLPEI